MSANANKEEFEQCKQALNMEQKQQFGLTEAGLQKLRDAADPTKPHTYRWFIIKDFAQDGETLHELESLTGAIDCFNGLSCSSKRLGVTKDGISTVNLVVTEDGETYADDGWQNNPRFSEDEVVTDAVARLQLSIAGLDQLKKDMTLGGLGR